MFGKAILALALLAGLAYAGDYISLRFGIPSHRTQFDSVAVQKMYAVKLKNGQTSYMLDQPQTVDCVNSLFSHFGDTPCWYLKRHTQIQIDMDSGPPKPLIDTP